MRFPQVLSNSRSIIGRTSAASYLPRVLAKACLVRPEARWCCSAVSKFFPPALSCEFVSTPAVSLALLLHSLSHALIIRGFSTYLLTSYSALLNLIYVSTTIFRFLWLQKAVSTCLSAAAFKRWACVLTPKAAVLCLFARLQLSLSRRGLRSL